MKLQVTLSEEDIEKIINGESVHVSNNHGEVEIKQSLMKDATIPLINRNKKVYSDGEIQNIKRAATMMADTFKLGY